MPWKSWTSVTAPFVEGRCQIRREQTFSQLRFIFHLTFPPLLVTWHAKGSGELDLPVALVQGGHLDRSCLGIRGKLILERGDAALTMWISISLSWSDVCHCVSF